MEWGEVLAALQFAVELLWEDVRSPFAQRIYALVGGLLLLIWSFRQALREKSALSSRLDGQPFANFTFMGRPPVRPEAIRAREEARLRRRREAALDIVAGLALILILGVVVPTILFALGTAYYGWFDASVAPLLDHETRAPVTQINLLQLGAYVVDHLLRGGLFDLIEVFQLGTASVTNNDSAYFYSVGVFVYHLYVEGFLLFTIVTAVQAYFKMQVALNADAKLANAI